MKVALTEGGDYHAEQLGNDIGQLVWQVGSVASGAVGAVKGGALLAKAGIKVGKKAGELLYQAGKNPGKMPLLPAVNRTQELVELFSHKHPRKGIQIGNKSLLELPNSGNAKIFAGASESEIKQYFLELTGSNQLPVVRNFSLRNFASSSGQTGSVWTIDIPGSMTGTSYNREIKFLKEGSTL